jgi:arylformamidase
MSAHTGTHVDAPLHYFIHGAAVDAMPLEVGFGPARVIEIRDCLRIGRQELEQYSLRRGDRILLRTQRPTRFPDYVSLTPEAAEYMVACGVVLVGIDTLSIGSADEGGAATHCTLLAASVWIVEGLDLSEVEAGEYDLVCLPLRIAGADGAPARVLIRPR